MKRIALKKKEVGSQPQIHTRDDLAHWGKLEIASKQNRVPSVDGKTIAGSTIRTHALEWLRLESIRLAYKLSPRRVLQLIENDEYYDAGAPDIDKYDVRHAFGKDRDALIAWPPRAISWVFPYLTPSFSEAFCFDVFSPEDIQPNTLRHAQQSGRMIISIDPNRATSAIAALRTHLRKHGTPGTGGNSCSLPRLREALLTYEVWLGRVRPTQSAGAQIHEPKTNRDNAAIRDIGAKLQRYEPPSQNAADTFEKRAQKTLECARQMLRAALQLPRTPNKHNTATEQTAPPWPSQYR